MKNFIDRRLWLKQSTLVSSVNLHKLVRQRMMQNILAENKINIKEIV